MEDVAHPAPELRQRAALGAGALYDLQQKRELAVKQYNLVVSLDGLRSGGDGSEVFAGALPIAFSLSPESLGRWVCRRRCRLVGRASKHDAGFHFHPLPSTQVGPELPLSQRIGDGFS